MNSEDSPKDANPAPAVGEPSALGSEPLEATGEVSSAAPVQKSSSFVPSQPPMSRKLAPPPKPPRDSRPSSAAPGADGSATATTRTLSSPMIVVGGSPASPPRPSTAAAAWTRPASEPPRPGSSPARVPPTLRREVPPASVEALRAKLEFGREKPTNPGSKAGAVLIPPRPASKPDDDPPRAGDPAPVLADVAAGVPRSLAEAVALEASEPAVARDRASSPDLERTAVVLPPPKPVTVTAPGIGADEPKAAEPPASPLNGVESAAAMPEASAAVSAPNNEAAPSSDPPPDTASDSEAPAERPRSSPARRRSGPPRPRLSSAAGIRTPSSPPRAQARSADAEPGSDGDDPELPPAPKMPEFVPAASASSSADDALGAAERKSDPPVPAPAIAVMKIIAVGDGDLEIPTEIEDETDGIGIDIDVTDPISESEARLDAGEAPLAAPARSDELEELPVEELAPDSSERPTPVPDGARDDAISIPPGEIVAEGELTPVPVAREPETRPPPPPKRSGRTPSLPKPVPQAKRRQKRPWWEDVFGDDFVRANFRMSPRQIDREVDFIEESLGVAAGAVVLDLGCGPGHHAVELASRGYGVVGYDLSLYQLALASDVAQERGQKLNFLQGDMREMAFDEMFDGIFSWNTSFGYFEEEKNVEVAERVFRALRPGGMFLIDVVNRDFVSMQSPCQLWYEGDSCVCMDDMSLDFITSRMRVKRSVILDDGRTRECVYSIRVYSLHELGKLLHDVGFRVTEASGHPSMPGVFFGEFSPRIIVLAQKP